MLLYEIAPLMQWRNIGGNEAAHRFDLLVCRMQTEHLKKSSSFDDLKAELQCQLNDLRMNLSQVKAVAPPIARGPHRRLLERASPSPSSKISGDNSGASCSIGSRADGAGGSPPPKVIDVKEDLALVERKKHVVKLEGLQLAAYRNRVEKVLKDLFESNDTLKRIKNGEPVSQTDLEALTALVLTQDPMLDLHDLVDYYPDCAGHLDLAIRSIIGLDAEAVHEHSPPSSSSTRRSTRPRSGSWTCSRTTSPSTAPSRSPACTSRRSPISYRQHRRPVRRQPVGATDCPYRIFQSTEGCLNIWPNLDSAKHSTRLST